MTCISTSPAGCSSPTQHNWWGTTDNLAIAERIYDWNDNDTKATASYTLKLSEPDQTAPAYVRSVTVLPDTTLGIQTGTFQALFSRPMDGNVTPVFHLKSRWLFVGYSGEYAHRAVWLAR